MKLIPERISALEQRIDTNVRSRIEPSLILDIPQQFNSMEVGKSPIRLKDVAESIPRYDGHKMSVFQFCKTCEKALDLVPRAQEYYLVQLIINKLQGHAYQAVEGSDIRFVSELTRRLKHVFGPNKSLDQYRGELGNAYMKQGGKSF